MMTQQIAGRHRTAFSQYIPPRETNMAMGNHRFQ